MKVRSQGKLQKNIEILNENNRLYLFIRNYPNDINGKNVYSYYKNNLSKLIKNSK